MPVNWTPLNQVDFSSSGTKYWVVDTRDFYVNTVSVDNNKIPAHLDLDKLSKYPNRFFSTSNKIKEILTNLYHRSGGEGKWRFLSFKNQNLKETDNWQLKYLFIFKTQHGLLICDRDKKPIRKDLFQQEIDEKVLAHQ